MQNNFKTHDFRQEKNLPEIICIFLQKVIVVKSTIKINITISD